MTQQQRIASDPTHSVWVSANAGSGKTRVLTDRVLRLLLKGIAPHRILCLTYTKAAAAEMALRVQAQLSEWITADDWVLDEILKGLLGREAQSKERKRARQLFAAVADAPEGLRIQTIHSLCQSLLRRFSVEAGISPHFRLMEDREAHFLMEEAKEKLFLAHRHHEEQSLLLQAIRQVAGTISEYAFHEILEELIALRSHFGKTQEGGLETYQEKLEQAFDIPYRMLTEEQLASRHFSYSPEEAANLRNLIPILLLGSPATDQPLAKALTRWLDCYETHDEKQIDAWLCGMLTEKNMTRAKYVTKAITERVPQAEQWMQAQAQRAYDFYRQRNALRQAKMSECLWHIAQALTEIYEHLKTRRGVLDYEDLIETVRNLLTRPGIAPWVMYKLDGGIDHLLLDEAQDTSPAQWQIIEAITSEFFAGESAGKVDRSLFVVGDEKQSIFSFQGAEPRAFAAMKRYFLQRIKQAQKPYEAVSLSLSFRSTETVLRAVDAVFARAEAKSGVAVGESEILHQAHRPHPGKVELWPLCIVEEEEESEPWNIPSERKSPNLPDRLLALRIAETVEDWLRCGRAAPGDILMLVQRRSRFFHYLIEALRQRNIPVAGADRLKLSEHIAVQDMLAFARFLLLPEDDLNLAGLLKSPLFGISEEELFELCDRRPATLWERLRLSAKPTLAAMARELEYLLGRADYLPPFEMFSLVLEARSGRKKILQRLGEQANDPLNELLSLALDYEKLHPPSLQGFVHWFEQAEIEIKRDMDRPQGEVRVMTVHGAKGLEAPIVFLPDTTHLPEMPERIFWQEPHGIFVWSYSRQEDSMLANQLRQQEKVLAKEEYRRLLYVAMTRAADELYICGWRTAARKISEESWYALVSEGLRHCAEPFDFDWQGKTEQGLRLTGFGYENPSLPLPVERAAPVAAAAIPEWTKQPVPEEPYLPRPLAPSRPEGAEPSADSVQTARYAIERGKIIHALLEILPEIPEIQRGQVASLLIRREAKLLSVQEKQEIMEAVLHLLQHPDFRPVFGPGSQAEVPVSAILQRDGAPRVLTGQIDRLLIGDEILLLDYKTSRRVPAYESQIPLRYRLQLQAYAEALRQIYPTKLIRAAILWTAGPLLMPVTLNASDGLDAA